LKKLTYVQAATVGGWKSLKKPKCYARLERRASRLKRRIWALYLSLKDPATPLLARIVIVCAIAYALSPIDLIPDFIPILGQLDDLVILPALIALALKLIPSEVTARCRREAWKRLGSGERVRTPAAIAAAILFGLAWLSLAAWILSLIL
jgi:uncharacterized membrane protein YkvA (DUF1232 family)